MGEQTLKLLVDGHEVLAAEGETLLDACRRLGADVPTLCHHDALAPYAACRVCLVELTGERGSTLVASCHYPAAEGLVVATNSDAVREGRRLVLQLLLARCPASNAVRDLAARYGVTETPFASDDPNETCILCGLCVRVCEELVKTCSVGFASRGLDRRVAAPFDESSQTCIGCAACVNVCPTGRLVAAYDGAVMKLDFWKTELELAACAGCGRFFAPKRLVEWVAGQAGDLKDQVGFCPSCRCEQTRRKWAQAAKALISMR